MGVELLPCPFCGSTDGQLVQAFTRATDTFAYWSVECLGCGCEIADDESQEAADAAWNIRAPTSQAPDTSPAPAEGASGTEVERLGSIILANDTKNLVRRGKLLDTLLAARAHSASDRNANKHSDVSLTDKSPESADNTVACGAPLVASDREARLVEALRRISALCPVTADMSTAHMMAAEADAALVELGEKL